MDGDRLNLASELEKIRDELQRVIGESRALGFQCHKWFYSEQAEDPAALLAHVQFCRDMLREHFQAVSVLAARAGAVSEVAAEARRGGYPEGPRSRIPSAWPAVPAGPKH